VNPFSNGLKAVRTLAASRGHGDRLTYLAGCKCFKCRRANSDYERARQAARIAGDWNGIVPATVARRHLLKLARLGIGRRQVAAATDISQSILVAIRRGSRQQIRARTERKILAVTPAIRGDASLVPATRAWRLIEELRGEGFTLAELASRMGYKNRAIQIRKDWITARNEQRVIALHQRLTT
jgi:hypothetical protein